MTCPTCRIPLSAQDYWCSQCGQYFKPQGAQPSASQHAPASNPQPTCYQPGTQAPYQQPPYQAPYQQTPYQQAPYQQAPYQQSPYQQAPTSQQPYSGSYPQQVPPVPRAKSNDGSGKSWLGFGGGGLTVVIVILKLLGVAGRAERTRARSERNQERAAQTQPVRATNARPNAAATVQPVDMNWAHRQPEMPKVEMPQPRHMRPAAIPHGMPSHAGMAPGMSHGPGGAGMRMHGGPAGMPGGPSGIHTGPSGMPGVPGPGGMPGGMGPGTMPPGPRF